MKKLKLPQIGIVSCEWVMGPDGDQKQYFFCSRWEIITNAIMPIEGFRSSEKWQLIARNARGHVVALIPGCKVRGFMKAPASAISGNPLICNLD